MSLGIIAKWRGQPLRLGPLIPRAPLLDRYRPASSSRSLRHFGSTTLLNTESGVSSTSDQDEGNEALTVETETIPKSPDPRDSPEFDDLEWAATSRSAFVKPAKVLPSSKGMARSWQEHHRSVIMQIRNARFREYIEAAPADWGLIHDRLFSMTEVQPRDWIHNGLKITLPRSIAREMLQEAGDFTIAAIRRRTQTTITFSAHDPVLTTEPSPKDGPAQSTMFVSGSLQGINNVIDQVRRAAGKITITRLYSPLGTGETEVETLDEIAIETLSAAESKDFNNDLRSLKFLSTPLTRAEGTHSPRRWIDHHVNLTHMPPTWTTASFEAYVKDLVDSAVLRPLHAQVYNSKSRRTHLDHEKAVTIRLLELFNIAPAVLVASCSALKIALRYICSKGPKHFADSLKLVAIMESRGFRLDTQVFNIMLLTAVEPAEPSRFFSRIKRMKRTGYKPDLETWILFLRMTKSGQHRSMILQTMRSKNLLATPEALRSVAKEMAADDTERAVAAEKDLDSFLKEQEERYGPTWLTRTAGNAMIDVLCSYKRFDDAFKMLDIMSEVSSSIPPERANEKFEARPNSATFNTILVHARTLNRMKLAVNTQRKLAQSDAIGKYFDLTPLDLLFDIAWKSRLRSSLVVIWRYASLGRMTTWHMRQRVAGLLQGKVGDGKFDISESVYRALGGERLARELAGGRYALARIRGLAGMKTVGGIEKNQSWYREKLAALATRAIALAFPEQYPAVEPGEVLAQSMLVDLRCLRARKEGTLDAVLRQATVKDLPLVEDRSCPSRVWIDVARAFNMRVQTAGGGQPLHAPQPIGPDDTWLDSWDSEGWKLESATSCIAIIDPRVWADMVYTGPANRTNTQTHNENMILRALRRLEKRWEKKQLRRATHWDGKKTRAAEAGEVDELGPEEQPWDEWDLELETDGDATGPEVTRDHPNLSA